MYWVEPLNHNNFDYIDQQLREKFLQCLDANCKSFENIQVLKLRDYWDKSDDNLVYNNKFSKADLSVYWRSMDASFQFNVKKRHEFLIRNKFRAMKVQVEDSRKSKGQSKRAVPEDTEEDIPNFFKKCRDDRFHWLRKDGTSGNRFLLPRPK